jgi:hypothetical protein
MSKTKDLSRVKAEDVYAAPVVVRVNRTVKVGGKDEASDSEERIIEVRKFVTEPAHVRFNYPIKRSLEYQGAGIEIGVDIPCYREEVRDGIKEAVETVVAETAALLPEVDKVLDRLVEQALEAKVAIARGTWSPAYKK